MLMKTARLQIILAVLLSVLLLLTVAPVAVFAADAVEYVDAHGEAQTAISASGITWTTAPPSGAD